MDDTQIDTISGQQSHITDEPDLEWQHRCHRRILAQDPTAFAELCEVAMPHLEAHLQLRFPLQDDHTRQSVIIDLLLSYNARPTVYDPNRLSLFSFLRMAARRDMLNALSKKRRHNRRVLGDDVIDKHPWSSDENVMLARLALAEWLDEQTNLSFEQVIAELEARLTEEEKNILRLMLDGERSTAQFAEVMGISHLDEPVQRYRVKRMKDRIKKRLRRFGRAIGRN